MDFAWLDEPVARSAGQFEVNVGTPCILELMKWFGLKSTFFTPGWIAEQYPAMVEAVLKDGHEIGLHGYLHEPPPNLSETQEVEIVRRGSAALKALTGVDPIGYRSPIWQFSANTVRILHDAGFKYTSDFMHTMLPTWNQVDGAPIDMINLPGSWVLDDAVYFQFHISIRTAMRRAADVLEIYKEEFRAVHAVRRSFHACHASAVERAAIARADAQGVHGLCQRLRRRLAAAADRRGRVLALRAQAAAVLAAT